MGWGRGLHQRSTFLSKNMNGPRSVLSEELNGPGGVTGLELFTL